MHPGEITEDGRKLLVLNPRAKLLLSFLGYAYTMLRIPSCRQSLNIWKKCSFLHSESSLTFALTRRKTEDDCLFAFRAYLANNSQRTRLKSKDLVLPPRLLFPPFSRHLFFLSCKIECSSLRKIGQSRRARFNF